MAQKSIGALLIHGMGSQGRTKPRYSSKPTYSKELHRLVKRELGEKMDRVAWREVFFAHVLQKRQEAYLRSIKGRTDFDNLRRFVMCSLSDAASYRKTSGSDDSTYEAIHREVKKVARALEKDLTPEAPIVIIAHSLGGHIMSNYIYDQQKPRPGAKRNASPLSEMRTVAGLITLGCNIPVFTFAYPEDEVVPIMPPNGELDERLRFKTWWYNAYDRDDVLGYPLKDIGPKYAAIAKAGGIRDVQVNAGGWWTSWNPASHNAYWKDSDICELVSGFLAGVLEGVDAIGAS
ncbi:MAG: hypothetical protein OXH79_07820 [Boseongicola sp.]|nr:hypothetical protein [Boseongicola sp.]